jgi:hypothetical protein
MLRNQVTLKTSLSVRYCTLFKVQYYRMNELHICTKKSITVEVHGSFSVHPYVAILFYYTKISLMTLLNTVLNLKHDFY